MKTCLLFITLCMCMCMFMCMTPPPPASTICPTQPSVDCEECLTDCCEELLIAIKTWEDCNCTPINGTQAEDEVYLYRRIYYKQLFIWLRAYCQDHNGEVKFYY